MAQALGIAVDRHRRRVDLELHTARRGTATEALDRLGSGLGQVDALAPQLDDAGVAPSQLQEVVDERREASCLSAHTACGQFTRGKAT